MTNDEAIKRQIKQNERKLWIMERDFRAAIVELMEANPEFDLSCATDLACSTNLAMQWILAGKIDHWTTWSRRCLDYPYDDPPDCPS